MDDKINAFRHEIATYLAEIEIRLEEWGLSTSKLTLIARDPDNDEMSVLLTNESSEGLRKAVDLAINLQGK